MGMFDSVKCDYPLPWPEAVDFGFEWQTKSTDAPYLDHYEIRADGTLWREEYTVRHEDDPDAPLGFWTHRENKRWVQVKWSGEFEIYHLVDDRGWYEVKFWFRDSVVADAIPRFEPRPKPLSPPDIA